MTSAAPHPIPGRVRPFEKTQGPTPRWLHLILGRELAPTRLEFDAVTQDLWQGDPAMDTLVDWMFTQGGRDARHQFETALKQGIGKVPDASEPLRAFFKTVDNPPPWLDRALLAEGARFIHGVGIAGPMVLRDLALMGGYLLSGFNQSLVMTGALNKGTARRVAETGKWWMDCTEIGGLERFGAGFASTLHVRLVHALVRRSLAARSDWDSAHWGTPLSQIDMVGTYLGFSVVMLGGLRKLGIPVTARESRAVMHLWSYACWLMGVDQRWLCFDEREGVVLLHHTMMTQSKPDWTSRELAVALSKEPLERHFEHFQTMRRQFAYQSHLSVSQYFLGTDKMRQLGLPEDTSSWYPLATLLPRFSLYSAQRFVHPGLKARQELRGRETQRAALMSIFGDAVPDIIKPDAKHPGHMH